jgi:pimeloyl-ACP methyl ester carboxylesterase
MQDALFLDLPHARLEYQFLPAAAPGRPVLVLLHEALGSLAHWKDFPAVLAAASGCALLVYSRQGHGNSSPAPQPRRLDYLSVGCPDELGAVLDACGLERVVLVGHSDGASIALAYAGRNDPRVCGVVAMAPHVLVEEVTLAGVRHAAEHFRAGDVLERLRAYHGANLEGVFAGWVDSWLHPDFAGWTLDAELTRIGVPLLAFQGCDDQYASAAQLERIAARVSAPCRTALLDACRHIPHREARAATLELIDGFLREHGFSPCRGGVRAKK